MHSRKLRFAQLSYLAFDLSDACRPWRYVLGFATSQPIRPCIVAQQRECTLSTFANPLLRPWCANRPVLPCTGAQRRECMLNAFAKTPARPTELPGRCSGNTQKPRIIGNGP